MGEYNTKTFKNLYPQVYDFDNLYWAYRAARRGKRDRVAVADFEFNLEHRIPGEALSRHDKRVI